MKKLAFGIVSASALVWGTAASQTPRDPLGFVERYATQYGLSQSEARRRLKATDRAIAAQTALRKMAPATFGGLHIEQSPNFTVVVKLAGAPSAAVQRILRGGAYRVETSPYSERELIAAKNAVVEDLRSRGVRHSAGIDIRASKVIVSVVPTDATRIGASYAKGLNSIYEWRTESGFIQPTFAPFAAYNGGDRLWGASGKYCTSGFHAKTASGTPVITTAGHCDDDMRIWNSNGTRIPQLGERNKGSLDIQWHSYSSSTYYLAPAIEGGSWTHDIYAVRSKSQMAIGQHVCKYGHKTYLTCGDIYDLNFEADHNGERGVYVRVRHQNGEVLTDEGDSGGPVFAWHENVGYTAYGIVHGRGKEGTSFRNDLFFMPSDGYAAAGLTIMVRTD